MQTGFRLTGRSQYYRYVTVKYKPVNSIQRQPMRNRDCKFIAAWRLGSLCRRALIAILNPAILSPSVLCPALALIIGFLIATEPVVAQDKKSEKPSTEQKSEPNQKDESTKAEPKKANNPDQADTQTTPARKPKFKFEKRGAIEYSKGDDYRLTCDVYVPEGDGPFPTVLAVHGGAWRGGSKLHMLRHAWMLARRGYVVVAINYRHAPKHKFPAQIHDCKNAIRWMRENADEYKIDSDRIAAYGYSAGGHLVSLLGTMDKDDGLDGEALEGLEKHDTRVCAVIAGGPVCEFDWVSDRSGTLVYWLGKRKSDDPDSVSYTHLTLLTKA